MLIVLNGTPYKMRSPYELSLRDLLALELETTAMGRTMNLEVIEVLAEQVQQITDPDPVARKRKRGASSAGLWLFAVQVYASRRIAGEDCTFAEAIEVQFSNVETIPEDDDPPELDALDPRRRPADHKPSTRRQGSGRATPKVAAKKAPARKRAAATPSRKRSTPASPR